MTNETQAPAIETTTAAALCSDEHIGAPALDDAAWQGASDSARCCVWSEWAFCYDDETERLDAINADGDTFYAVRGGEWQAH